MSEERTGPEGAMLQAGSRQFLHGTTHTSKVAIHIRVDGTYILCRHYTIVLRTFIDTILSSISPYTYAVPFMHPFTPNICLHVKPITF